MSEVGQRERETQNRIVKLFKDKLGYTYLGNWEERENNSNIEEELLTSYLKRKNVNDTLINKTLDKLRITANNYNESLYTNNKNIYSLLRYGVQDKTEAGEKKETVELIDWKHPEKNDFAIAEEVTVLGNREKRPDIVIYVNGIALAVLELKRSTISIGEGIRQSIVNQKKEFIEQFFSTVQFIFAGNDTEGLRYGTIGTPEKYYLNWNENEEDSSQLLLDKYLTILCDKKRFLELIYDYVLFDAGIKKLPRHHQFFGVKEAQSFCSRHEGGIIWHTQGSGKSLVMVWLSKWLLENNPQARVVIITDRDELDKQIERVYNDAGEKIVRTRSGRELMEKLGNPLPRMFCSLVHKFGKKDVDNFDQFIKELQEAPSKTYGDIFVFVDECHRTQSGKLHKTMKAIMKNATFIGFTGTPLLKQDKQTSLEVFGRYIHTYKFNEAVEDGVVLDLVYEARDIDQKISSPQKIDAWFEAKTKGLNDYQKSELKKKWGTMQKVLSSASRLDMIVKDIIYDFNTKPRLNSDRGNAILVSSSIYEASRYFELFQKTELRNKCAIITSYNPSTKDIVTEDTGANTDTEKEFIYNTYINLLNGKNTETYEDEAKKKFIKEPSNMRLLVVVDKLLTGFDAPPCTYLYIDKSMQDHGLFQAICRVNRLDGEDKQFGYVVDYKDLFKRVENAVAVYTADLDYDEFEKEDVDIMLKTRLEKGKERLDNAIEELNLLCEPVEPPRGTFEYIRFFCGNPENKDDLKATEVRRIALYKNVASLIRAYANIADEIDQAGYTPKELDELKETLNFYLKLREEIKRASGEVIDLKTYEADMRFLIDNYIQAEESKTISPFGDQTLLDIIVNSGIADAINNLPKGIRENRQAIQETIENNVRQKIIKEYLIDPAYFEEMSKLLDEIVYERRIGAIEYEKYLKKIAALAKRVNDRKSVDLPIGITTNAHIALYNNLSKDQDLALKIDEAVRYTKKADFRGNPQKENEIKAAIYKIMKSKDEVERIFLIIKQQSDY
ncbi:MAG: HsdR family type I site-specific deoxyribonuclease [Ignavibacteriota bacterium]|nr:HsdR family type I site-specific deoxyribonuclease [Ignavibacteriales bacterium]MBL1122589.1 HsdR family type I site-specific deoxyribonuclease [Ignavibacteriota bacterium]MCE7856329.1 HsdR family type I site-specific deoxyribonuclease [Ignavibacteria bacterium CHB3]GJQ40680.1 MAG: restriction endonuclease [Ignavibacteriaceae bacterium]QKJ95179.1 MAG: HsdR family type I site-specific deoxyribonuclease [Ignavibacteriota bacterium]